MKSTNATEPLTAEQFADQKLELPEGGRWTELVAGRIVTLTPIDDAHGNCVRNLSTALAAYAHQTQRGYACFEIGLIVARGPDTVRCPPVSYFLSGPRFAELEKLVTDARPGLVVEIASTNDRRRDLEQRITEYLDWGVPLAWIIDPHAQQVHAFELGRRGRVYSAQETLLGGTRLPELALPVGQLFAEPKWWR
jgi:Uma2 family endonuclease